MTQFRDEYILHATDSLPEGVAFDAKTKRFFATGLMSGTVTQVDAETGEEQLFFRPEGPPQQLSGAKVDEKHRRLWVCYSEIQRMIGGVLVFDVDTGARLGSFELSRAGICNDVALDSHGVAYVTDSFQPVIYRVDLHRGEAGEFRRDPKMAAPPGLIGLNGVAVTPDDEYVIGGFTSPSKLFVTSRRGGKDDAVHEISFVGDPFVPGDPNFPGADGIIFIGDQLYVIHDGGVQQVTFIDDKHDHAQGGGHGHHHGYRTGRVKNVVVREPGLSTGTVAGGQLYVVKSEVVRTMHQQQPPRLPFKIYRVPLNLFG